MGKQTGSISFEATGGFNSYAKQNYATLSQIKGQFATSTTGANDAAKVATIIPSNTGWELYSGATVTVKFSNANSATGTLTLNVNSSGAKEIRDYNGNNLEQAARAWSAGAAMALTYDGTYWRIQDSNLIERMHSAETEINQTATSITSLATLEDTYTKPDGTIGTNSIKSQFTQTANAINAKVDKDGVIASINASVEEENGSQIKISADKVNITGTTIFSALGSANKVVTSTQTQWYSSTSATTKTDGSWGITQPTVTAGRYVWERQYITYSNGDTEYKPSEAGVCIQGQTDLSSYSTTTQANNLYASKSSAVSRTQRIYYRTDTALTNSITGPETWISEFGNRYNTTAPTTAITGWSTKLTPLAASTAADATKYLYLYTCIQTQTVEQAANNGTQCSASTVLLDDTETIIDGGNIITGTVTANKISVDNLAAINSDLGTLTAGYIDASQVVVDNLNANNISTNLISAINDFSQIDEDDHVIKISADKVEIDGSAIFSSIQNDVQTAAEGVVSNLDDYIRGLEYVVTSDTEAQEEKVYYSLDNGDYIVAEVTTGDSVEGLYERVLKEGTVLAALNAEAEEREKIGSDLSDFKRDNGDELNGLSNQITALQTGVADNSGSITAIQSAITSANARAQYIYLKTTTVEELPPVTTWVEGESYTAASGTVQDGIIYYTRDNNNNYIPATVEIGDATTNLYIVDETAWKPYRPAYDPNYPVLYTAIQRQTVSQMAAGLECSCTPPEIDDSLTVIDGGRIISHSITAEQIDVNALKAALLETANLIIGNREAARIEMSGQHIGFVSSDGSEVAYIDIGPDGRSTFYMTRSVVVDDMFLGEGKWKFYKRANNNLSLKWMGGDN